MTDPTHPTNGRDPMFTVVHQDALDQPSTVWSTVNANGTMDLWDGGVLLLESCTPPEIQQFLEIDHG